MGARTPDSLQDSGPISEINVTPFVDVVLVLLVIFMVTAPALLKDNIGLQLPKAGSADSKKIVTLGVAVNKQGQILLNGVTTTREALEAEVKQTLSRNPETQAIIAADADARHGDVVRAIDWIKSAGLSRFAIQIQKEDPAQ